jgi:hypothetical protein
MLENSSLLLLPWTRAHEQWCRGVHDAADATPLGLVRWFGSKRSWLSWFPAYRLEFLETEDEALLMSLVRSWGFLRLWDLYDAEENRVGSIYPPVLLDAAGQRRGYLRLDNADRGEILDVGGKRLADFEGTQKLRISFAAGLEANPFLRMLLLAAVLTAQPVPR